jgi:hypothetical protein
MIGTRNPISLNGRILYENNRVFFQGGYPICILLIPFREAIGGYMINPFWEGIVWLYHGKCNEEGQPVTYKVPYKAKVIGDYAVRYDPDDKLWGVIHAPSGMRARGYKKQKDAELVCLNVSHNMVNTWNGIDSDNLAFLEECMKLINHG